MTQIKHHFFFKLAASAALLLLLGMQASATIVKRPLDDDLIVGARAIVTGKVTNIESAWDEGHVRVYTYVTLKVGQVLKGEINQRKIVIKELGGRVGDEGTMVWGSPEFKKGEKVLVYLSTWPDGSLRVYQMLLGKFSIIKDPETGHRFVVRNLTAENVTVLGRLTAKGITTGGSTDQMELATYIAMITTRLNLKWDESERFLKQNFGDAPMLARPPDYTPETGREYEPQWTYIHPAHPRWFEPDSGLPVTFDINPEGAPSQQVLTDINAAMGAWSNLPGCSLRVVTGSTTANCKSNQENVIFFNNCDGYWQASPGCASVLALGGLNWNFNSRVINGVTFLQGQGGFISFNPYASCDFGTNCNVQEIATHELGHALGLGHTADSTATMFAYIHFDGRCAGIKTDDLAAITFIYPGTGGGGGPLSISTSSLPGGTVGTAYNQSLQATGGTAPYSWQVVQGSLPTGLNLGSGGSISGTPSAAATFNFTVQVSDSASGSVQKALSIVISSPGSGLNSQFVSQSVPSQVNPGQVFVVTLSWFNNGTQTWDGSNGFTIRSQNPAGNTTWGGSQVNLAGLAWAPGQTAAIQLQVVAPATSGSYNFQWQTYQSGTGYFGQASTNVAIQVGQTGGGATDGATFVSQTVSATMTAGQVSSVSVTMQNSGTTTWSAGTYQLGSQNPQNNLTWGLNRVNLSSSVAPGSSATFTFNITAPAAAGTYNFQWQMFNGSAFFGALTTNVAVTVSGGGGGGGGPYDAAFVSQTVPSSMTPGLSYNVAVTMRNAGTQSWTSSGGFSLSSQNPAGNSTWGINRVSLNKLINPGSQYTIMFTVTAPSTPGTYNFQWEMKRDASGYFGQMSANVAVQVGTGGGATDGASFVSQSVPSSMTAGQLVPVSVTMLNSGSTTWQAGTYFLGSLNPTGNTTWGLSQVSLPGSVAPGASAAFNFNVTAPSSAGNYNFQWGMKHGVSYFGAAGTNVVVSVSGGGGGGNDSSQYISQTVSAALNTGQTTSVSVTMMNSGTTTWMPGTYVLASRNPAGNTIWGLSSVGLASSIAPGSSATFNFNITAPSTAGTYNFQWQMQKGATSFGALSANVAIVVSSGSVPPLSITTTSLPMGFKGYAYSQQITATGGVQPYTWSISSGSLPGGVTLKSTTGILSGTPTTVGIYTFTVTVRDSGGRSASKTFKVSFK